MRRSPIWTNISGFSLPSCCALVLSENLAARFSSPIPPEAVREQRSVIGVDLGGTNVRAGLVQEGTLVAIEQTQLPQEAEMEAVLDEIHRVVEPLFERGASAIGIGVPSVVRDGVVYDVQNIPSWTQVPLQSKIEEAYGMPARVDNDANCFALGEWMFGEGRGEGAQENAAPPGPPSKHSSTLIGIIVGTGFAAGLVLEGRLYSGPNCGAGEIGMLPYRESIFEHYCSGQFFEREYGTTGAALFEAAEKGSEEAQAAFRTFGKHLGEGIKAALYAYDPDIIVLGGSARKAFPYFHETMQERIASFAFGRSLEHLKIAVSERDHIALLGAAALAISHRTLAEHTTN